MDSSTNIVEYWRRLYKIDRVQAQTPLEPLSVEYAYSAAEARFGLAREALIEIERLKLKGDLSQEQAIVERKKVSSEYHKDIRLLINRVVNYYVEEIE